jgi:hypothetical protein
MNHRRMTNAEYDAQRLAEQGDTVSRMLGICQECGGDVDDRRLRNPSKILGKYQPCTCKKSEPPAPPF